MFFIIAYYRFKFYFLLTEVFGAKGQFMGFLLADVKMAETSRSRFELSQSLDALILIEDDMVHPSHAPRPNDRLELLWRAADHSSWKPLLWQSPSGKIHSQIDIPKWKEMMETESFRKDHGRPLFSYLPFHYHKVPRSIRKLASVGVTVLRSRFQRKHYPVSFLNVGTALVLSASSQDNPLERPCSRALLTHDIESTDGFRSIPTIAELEESYGFRSVWNVVPRFYKVDQILLHSLIKRGHQIGMHGIWHNHRETFSRPATLRSAFQRLIDFQLEFGIFGYRSPSWYRTQKMFAVLSEFFSYDMSSLDCDLVCPAGAGGVGVHLPFKDSYGLIHIPCNIPFEVPCFSGVRPKELMAYWKPKLEFIKAMNGLMTVNSHPEREYLASPPMLLAYRGFLAYLKEKGWTSVMPNQILKTCAERVLT